MVNHIYEILVNLSDRPELFISESTLRALRDFLSGYQTAFAYNRIQCDNEEPPFRHFTGWLERRFGKVTTNARTGQILGTTKSCFMVIAEEYPDPTRAFQYFFMFLDEFRSLRTRVLGTVTLSVADQERLSDKIPGITEFSATQYLPEDGVYLAGVKTGVPDFDFGYFNSFESAQSYAEATFGICRNAWK